MTLPLTSGLVTIDRGNSSCKIAVWNGASITKSGSLDNLDIEEFIDLLNGDIPEGGIYSSVGKSDAKFLETLRRLFDGNLIVAGPDTPFPGEIKYKSPQTLGFDRLAAVAGASILYPSIPLLIVDAGTALTVDLTDGKGNFLGGNISPGVSLRIKSLNSYTDRLPLISPEGELSDFGTDTESALRDGCIGGMISEIADLYDKAKSSYGCEGIIITGGDSSLLTSHLKQRCAFVSQESMLVHVGLKEIYNYCRYSNQNHILP